MNAIQGIQLNYYYIIIRLKRAWMLRISKSYDINYICLIANTIMCLLIGIAHQIIT